MKRCTMILSTILLILALCACEVTSSFSYSFDVATGDRIKVELDTSTGLDLSQKDGRFFVKEGEDKIVEGLFITRETYEERRVAPRSRRWSRVKKTATPTGCMRWTVRPVWKRIACCGSKDLTPAY